MPADAKVRRHPRYNPQTAIIFMSPPPYAPLIIIEQSNMGTATTKAPKSLSAAFTSVTGSNKKKDNMLTKAIRHTIRSGTMPAFMSDEAHAESSTDKTAVTKAFKEKP